MLHILKKVALSLKKENGRVTRYEGYQFFFTLTRASRAWWLPLPELGFVGGLFLLKGNK